MTIYIADKQLLPQQEPLPLEGFLLPVCTNSERLNRMLTALWWGGFFLPSEPGVDDFSGHNIHGMTHIIDVLEAMRYVNVPWEVPCYIPPEPDPGSGCVAYPVSAPWLSYAPNDPFQTPNFTPAGYLLPPWYNNPLIPLPGVLPGDAMVNFAAFPVLANLGDMLASGLPRLSIPVQGEGELEIEFVNVPQGGYALVNIDGDPLQTQVINLNAISITDVVSLEGVLTFFGLVGEELGIEPAQTHEVRINGAGAHVVNITFLPNIGSDVLLGFGGGIRRIGMCGFDSVGEVPMPQLRIDNCDLEWRPHEGTPWVTLGNVCGADGQDGTNGIDGIDGTNGIDGIDGQDGQDGREIELRNLGSGGIFWRYVGDPLWQLLFIVPEPEEPGTVDTCASACDYAYSAIRNVENLIVRLVGWSQVLFPSTAFNLQNRNNFRLNTYTQLIFADNVTIADQYVEVANVMFELRHGRGTADNVYALQPHMEISAYDNMFELVREEVVNQLVLDMNDCGQMEFDAWSNIVNWLNTNRKDENRPVAERRALDNLYVMIWNIGQLNLREITYDLLWSAPADYCGVIVEPPPPPDPSCADTDWSIFINLEEGEHNLNIIAGQQIFSGVATVNNGGTSTCGEGYVRADVAASLTPATEVNRIILTYSGSKAAGLPSASVRLGTGLSTLASENFSVSGSNLELSWVGSQSISNLIATVEQCLTFDTQPEATVILHSILICGTGTAPTIGAGTT